MKNIHNSDRKRPSRRESLYKLDEEFGFLWPPWAMRKWLLTLFVLSCFIFPIILIPPGTAQDEAVGAKSDQHPAEKNEKQETESALYKFIDKLSL